MAPSDGVVQNRLMIDDNDSDTESCDSSSTLSDYCLPWLFDPHRIDHLPIEEQLTFYKQRDLRRVKIFKIATQIWGAPCNRKRIIVAPRMSSKDDCKADVAQPRPMNTELKPQKPPEKLPSQAEVNAWEQQKKIEDYKAWVSDRKKFRNDLENMGLKEEWLQNKPDKTPLEQKVLQKMIQERTPHPVTPPPVVEEPLYAVLPEESPTVKRPSPLAIHIIEQFLHEKKMRLIDLFAAADKDKDWLISREEFRRAVHKAHIPISEVLLEDLILALDTDLNDELDYRELAKGMGLWKIEKRESKRKIAGSGNLSPLKLSQLSGFESPDPQPSLESITPIGLFRPQDADAIIEEMASESTGSYSPTNIRAKSAISNVSSASSHLELPPPDVRQERRMYSSDEAMVDQRKRNKDVLRMQRTKSSGRRRPKIINNENIKSIIKTGEKAVDDHCAPSTLISDTAEQVDRFRQLKLREYNAVLQLCTENNVKLTKELLEKVLLYPKDRPVKHVRRHLRQPGCELISSGFTKPPKRPKSPIPTKPSKGERVKVTSSGRVMAAGGARSYPSYTDVAPSSQKMYLSTGKAHIRRKVDCWMSFEEYDRLTQHLAQKFSHLHGHSDDNAFWPGHLLDKLRLHMPNSDPKTGTVFSSVKAEKKIYPGFDNNLRSWTQNDSGFIQVGQLDPYSNKF